MCASSGYLKKSYWYSIPSLTAHRYKLNTFRELAMRCMKNTHALLKQLGALEERHLNLIFVDRLAELLPEKYFYRVVRLTHAFTRTYRQIDRHTNSQWAPSLRCKMIYNIFDLTLTFLFFVLICFAAGYVFYRRL